MTAGQDGIAGWTAAFVLYVQPAAWLLPTMRPTSTFALTNQPRQNAPALAQQRAELAAQAQAEVAEVGGQRGALAQPHHKPDGRDQQDLCSGRWKGITFNSCALCAISSHQRSAFKAWICGKHPASMPPAEQGSTHHSGRLKAGEVCGALAVP